MEKSKEPKKRLPHKFTLNKKWKLGILIFTALVMVSMISLLTYAAVSLPAFNPQQLSGANSTLLYDQDGQLFSSLHAGENRTEVTLDKIPPHLIQAFIATEDKDFYKHHGINFRGIARAMLRNVQSGDLTGEGASTITQQLARSSFLSADKKYVRKIKEVLLAFKIESAYSKEEILEMYLNKIYFGAGAYGVQAAANTYFGKDVSQLTLPESALLAGLVQSPNNYNPFTNLDKAKARQKLVLNSMAASGFIDEAGSSQAYDTELQLAKSQNTGKQYGYYVDAVIDEALQILKGIKGYEDADTAVYKSGLKIYTSLNAPLQSYAEEYFKDASHFPAGNKSGQKVQSGMAIIENSSGAVKAIMGGREYEQQRGFNRATSAYRQPGSSIKPLTVYSPALEQGKMPFLVLDDSPISYNTSTGVWSPKNSGGGFRGLITMRTAVQFSINVFAVQVEDLIGTRHGFDMGKSLGLSLVDTPGKNDLNLASLGLGGLTKGVTPVQMAAAYSTFGNMGMYNTPHFISKIVDNNGLTIYEFKPSSKRVMTEQTAWLMNSMMQDVVNAGTGTKAKVPNVPTAGKTGTTDDSTDTWFCGVTPAYSGAVWMGYDDQKNKMPDAYGGDRPALTFRAIMQKAYQGINAGGWTMPSNIVQVSVCSKSGKLPSPICPADQIVTEYCLQSAVPTETCDIHQNIVICNETGKLATQYCPQTSTIAALKVGEKSVEKAKIPPETCTIHTSFNLSGLLKNTVKICTDLTHNGQLYKANIRGLGQTGGCPEEFVKEIVIPAEENLSPCPLPEHQLK